MVNHATSNEMAKDYGCPILSWYGAMMNKPPKITDNIRLAHTVDNINNTNEGR